MKHLMIFRFIIVASAHTLDSVNRYSNQPEFIEKKKLILKFLSLFFHLQQIKTNNELKLFKQNILSKS